jgi:hypothetical protein
VVPTRYGRQGDWLADRLRALPNLVCSLNTEALNASVLTSKMLERYMVKPHEQLVRVSYMHYCTSTPRLSTLSSTRALQEA